MAEQELRNALSEVIKARTADYNSMLRYCDERIAEARTAVIRRRALATDLRNVTTIRVIDLVAANKYTPPQKRACVVYESAAKLIETENVAIVERRLNADLQVCAQVRKRLESMSRLDQQVKQGGDAKAVAYELFDLANDKRGIRDEVWLLFESTNRMPDVIELWSTKCGVDLAQLEGRHNKVGGKAIIALLRVVGISFDSIANIVEFPFQDIDLGNVLAALIAYFGFADKLNKFSAGALAQILNHVLWYLCANSTIDGDYPTWVINHPFFKREYISAIMSCDDEHVFDVRKIDESDDAIVAIRAFREVRVDEFDESLRSEDTAPACIDDLLGFDREEMFGNDIGRLAHYIGERVRELVKRE